MINQYIVETTQIKLLVYAQNEVVAIQMVCNAELCPPSAIKSIKEITNA